MPVTIIAEAGVNHNGSLEMAKEMARVAKACGADIVKYQTAVPELVVSKFAQKAEYQKQTTDAAESQLEMIRRLHFSFDAHRELKEYCDSIGIQYLSAPFDLPSVRFLGTLGLPLLKMTAQATGGEMSIASKPGEGTTVRVTFGLSHIDRPPMGDVPGVLYTLVLMNPTTDFRFALDYDGKTFVLDTREVREAVAPIPLNHPEISAWIRDCLKQNIDELHGGVFL